MIKAAFVFNVDQKPPTRGELSKARADVELKWEQARKRSDFCFRATIALCCLSLLPPVLLSDGRHALTVSGVLILLAAVCCAVEKWVLSPDAECLAEMFAGLKEISLDDVCDREALTGLMALAEREGPGGHLTKYLSQLVQMDRLLVSGEVEYLMRNAGRGGEQAAAAAAMEKFLSFGQGAGLPRPGTGR